MNDLESRSMRENLLFHGIEENQNDDCVQLVKTFCEDELLISHTIVENIAVDRTHRMRRVEVDSIRPIVVKFHKYSDRELIRDKASDLRNIRKSKNYTVKSQVPFDVKEKRKPLYSVFEAEKAKINRCKFVPGKIIYQRAVVRATEHA